MHIGRIVRGLAVVAVFGVAIGGVVRSLNCDPDGE
jgi:hypothetical protein